VLLSINSYSNYSELSLETAENTKTNDIIQNARFTIITSVIIALAVNLAASYIFSQQFVMFFIILGISIGATVYVLAHYSRVLETRMLHILVNLIYDRKTGKLTDYPDYVVQHLIRQTMSVISKGNPNIDSEIREASIVELNDSSKGILIDTCETIIVSQILSLLESRPAEYLNDFELSDDLQKELNNNIIAEIHKINDPSDLQIVLNRFDKIWRPRHGNLSIRRRQDNKSSTPSSIILQNKYVRITVDYGISHLRILPYVRREASFMELAGLPIDPRYWDDANQRLIDHGLLLASFEYYVRAEFRKRKLFTIILMLNIWPSKNVSRSFSFLNYFVDNIASTSFGSIDIRDNQYQEKSRLDNKFIMESLRRLSRHMDILEKHRTPVNDYSKYYIK